MKMKITIELTGFKTIGPYDEKYIKRKVSTAVDDVKYFENIALHNGLLKSKISVEIIKNPTPLQGKTASRHG